MTRSKIVGGGEIFLIAYYLSVRSDELLVRAEGEEAALFELVLVHLKKYNTKL